MDAFEAYRDVKQASAVSLYAFSNIPNTTIA